MGISPNRGYHTKYLKPQPSQPFFRHIQLARQDISPEQCMSSFKSVESPDSNYMKWTEKIGLRLSSDTPISVAYK